MLVRMAKPILSMRSERARELARGLARQEGRSVASIVERALDFYAARRKESARSFFTRLSREYGAEVDLDVEIRKDRIVAERILPFEDEVPNARTRRAMAQLEAGKGKRVRSVKALMKDLKS